MLAFLATLIAALLVLWAPLAIAAPQSGPDKKESKEAGDHDGDADSDASTTEDESEADESTADEGDNAHPSGKDRSVENSPEANPNQGKSESNPDDTNGPKRCEGVCGEDDKSNAGGGEDSADQDGNNGCGNDDDFDDDNNGWCGKPNEVDEDDDTDVGGDNEEKPCDADATMPGTQPCDHEQPNKPCDADATMPGTQPCDKGDDDDVEGEVIVDFPCDGDSTMPGNQPCLPNAPEVEGEDDSEMPSVLPGVVTNPADVEDSVLGERITRGSGVAAAVAPAAVAGATETEGAALPFTGGSVVQMLVTGLSLMTLGGVSVLARKR
jgi:hypothetical protein